MATKDLYGIGKGSAQVVDLRPLNATIERRNEANIARNEAKAKKRATNLAAIDSQLGKIKNTAWERDQEYISGLMTKTLDWQAEQYGKYGEGALYDNPELNREWNKQLKFIENQNAASHSQISMGNKNLEYSRKNLDDIDPESGVEFNAWLDLPSEERLRTPQPIIKDREMSLLEVMDEEGVQSAIEGTYIETGGTGLKDPETGRYTNYSGERTDEDAYNAYIDKYSTNSSEGRIFKYANRDAMKMIDTELYPTHIEENGEKVPNPEYQQELNKVRRQLIDDTASTWKKSDYKTSKSSYGAVVEEEKEEEPSGFRTSTGLSSSYFVEEGMEGFTLANPKTGSAVKPINASVEMPNGKFQTVKINPSHFIKTPAGNVIKGQVVQNTWEELSSSEKAKWEKENPGETAEDYNLSHSRGDVAEVVVTPSVESQMKDQYGISGFESHLEEVKGGKQESQKEEKITGKDFDAQWAKLKSGETLTAPDGKTYTKK